MKDLRDFITRCEELGELHRIKAEVDLHLELSHTAKMNEERKGPALLFENVNGSSMPVLTSVFTTVKRLAIILNHPAHFTMCEMARDWMKLTTRELIKPKKVANGPVLENQIEGDKYNVLDLPSPFFYPLDGGRYLGTAANLITRDPETGWTNLGTYRMQVQDKGRIGIQILKGKHAEFMLKQYKEMGKPMPAMVVIGGDPLLSLVGSTLVSAQVDEYDIVGALRGEPVEVLESDLTGLTFPAHAEIVIEGVIDPDQMLPEGPFAEYTGYYSGKATPKVFLQVQRVLHRNNPVFWATAVGRPINDVCMIQSLTRTAGLWAELETMAIPGIQSVYIPPESCGRYWAIVSVKQKYPGHSMQVGTAVVSTTTGHYGLKGVIVVDDDIAADDWDRVLWALSVRYAPSRSTQIIERGRSTSLDPSLPIDARDITSRIIMDACLPYEWADKPIEVASDKEMVKRVAGRWEEFGLGRL